MADVRRALLMVFFGVLGVLFWPAWSEDARHHDRAPRGRLALAAGDDRV
jgi:hypothetical protein